MSGSEVMYNLGLRECGAEVDCPIGQRFVFEVILVPTYFLSQFPDLGFCNDGESM